MHLFYILYFNKYFLLQADFFWEKNHIHSHEHFLLNSEFSPMDFKKHYVSYVYLTVHHCNN